MVRGRTQLEAMRETDAKYDEAMTQVWLSAIQTIISVLIQKGIATDEEFTAAFKAQCVEEKISAVFGG